MRKLNKIMALMLVLAILFTTSAPALNFIAAEEPATIDINVDQDDLLDVVLTLGQSDSDVSNLEADLLAALIAKGVPSDKIKIQAVESSEVSAGNTSSGWEVYDHTNNSNTAISYYRPYYNETNGNYVLDNHISVDTSNGTNIDFYGYGAPAYKDFMYMPNSDTGKKTFDFTILEGSFYDALNGAGFLFNTSMTSNTDLANRRMSGYLLFFRYPGSAPPPVAELYKFTNVDVNAFHNDVSTAIEYYSGFEKLATFQSVADSERIIKIEATADSFKMWYDGAPVTWRLVSNGTNTTEVDLTTDFGSYGFGPLVGYLSHGCNRLTHFTFNNVRMQTESTKRFSDVIREPEWRDESKRFIINAEDGAVPDFSDPEALGEILTRLGNENIHYLGWGRDNVDGEAFIAKNDGNGIYVDKDAASTDTYAEQINALAQYIYDNYVDGVSNDTEYLIYGKPSSMSITPESEQTNTIDADWPNGKWRIDQDENYYENSTGVVPYDEIYLNNLDISFTETGKYDIYYKDVLVKTVYVHRAPVATFSVTLDGSNNVSITDNAYDPDRETQLDKGIVSTQWFYKQTTASTWTSGMPTSFATDNNYVIKQVVTDEYDVESTPYLRYVTTTTSVTPTTPIAEFKVIPGRLLSYISESVAYEDTSYDPSGEGITEKVWKVFLGTTEIYSGSTPKTSFVGAAGGTYKITLDVKNASGIWSETAARYLTIVRDDTAPTATIDVANGTYNTVKTATLSFADETGGSGFSHRFARVTSSTTTPTDWGSMGTNSQYSVNLDDLGNNYVHYKIIDYAGNERIGYFGSINLIDNTAPSVPTIDIAPSYVDGSWKNNELELTASGSTDDFTDSADLVYEYSADGINYTSGNVITVSSGGTHTIYFRVTDESENSTVTSKTVKIDMTIPSVNLSMTSDEDTYIGNVWTGNTVDILLTANDAGGSDVKETQYKIDDGSWVTGDSYTFDSSGEYVLYYRSLDNAGNYSDVGEASIRVDLDMPEDFTIEATSTTIDSIDISAETSDSLSGLSPLGYRIWNGTEWSAWKSLVDETLDGYSRGDEVTIKVEARDNVGNTRLVSIDVTVLSNTLPVAVDDSFAMDEDSLVQELDLLANDTDADFDAKDGETLTIKSIGALSNISGGVLTLENGVVSFKPAVNYNGTLTFDYVIEDSQGATSTSTATIVVNSINDLPVANKDNFNVLEDSNAIVLNLLDNDTDVDINNTVKDVLRISSISGLSYSNAGTLTLVNGIVTFKPALNYNGTATFMYVIKDSQGGVATSVVTINVEAVNDAPVLVDDSVKTLYGKSVSIDVLANDSDIETIALKISGVSKPANGTATINSNQIVYTPESGFSGTDVFSYSVNDNGIIKSANVKVVVEYPEYVDENTEVFIPLPGGDDEGDDKDEEIKLVEAPEKGDVGIIGGSIFYTPKDGSKGMDIYSFIMKIGGKEVVYQALTMISTDGKASTIGYGLPIRDDLFEVYKNGRIKIKLSEYVSDTKDIEIKNDTSSGKLELKNGILTYKPNKDYVGFDGSILALNVDGEEVLYTIGFKVLDKEESLITWVCVIGWIIAAILLAVNWLKNKIYYRSGKYRLLAYVSSSVVLLVCLCLLRLSFGYPPSMIIAGLYILANFIYASYGAKKEKDKIR